MGHARRPRWRRRRRALPVRPAGVTRVGYLPTAYGMHPAFSYLIGVVVLFLLLRYVGRPDLDSPQWNDAVPGENPG